MLLTSKTFNIFLQDEYLKSHLIFLFNLAKTIIGAEFDVEDKGRLIDLIKKNIAKTNILAIGNGYSSNQMFKKAHISFEVKSKNEFFSETENADFSFNGWNILLNIISINVKSVCALSDLIIYVILYAGILQGLLNFYLSWFSNYSGISILNSNKIITINFIFLSICLLIFSVFEKHKEKIILRKIPIFYIHEVKDKYSKISISRFLLKIIIPSVVDSLLIFFFMIGNPNNSFELFSMKTYFFIMFAIYLQVNRIFFFFNFIKMH